MSAVETLPDYLPSLEPSERGKTFQISFETYRWLSRTALQIVRDLETEMAIYRLRDSKGAGLDIWGNQKCLSLRLDDEQISLYSAELDGGGVTCLLITANSADGWRQLGQVGRTEIMKS
jgi:hypothetical protein